MTPVVELLGEVTSDRLTRLAAWFFNDPAVGIILLLVGGSIRRALHEVRDGQRELMAAIAQHRLDLAAGVNAVAESAEKVHHAASGVLGTHKLTRRMIRRAMRRYDDRPRSA